MVPACASFLSEQLDIDLSQVRGRCVPICVPQPMRQGTSFCSLMKALKVDGMCMVVVRFEGVMFFESIVGVIVLRFDSICKAPIYLPTIPTGRAVLEEF